jgi:hypothetical protein
MIRDLIIVILGMLVQLLPYLIIDLRSSITEKRTLAATLSLSDRLFGDEPSIPVFKVVFDTLNAVVRRLFGPRVMSLRFILLTAIGSALFFWTYLVLVISNTTQQTTIAQRMF